MSVSFVSFVCCYPPTHLFRSFSCWRAMVGLLVFRWHLHLILSTVSGEMFLFLSQSVYVDLPTLALTFDRSAPTLIWVSSFVCWTFWVHKWTHVQRELAWLTWAMSRMVLYSSRRVASWGAFNQSPDQQTPNLQALIPTVAFKHGREMEMPAFLKSVNAAFHSLGRVYRLSQ